MKLHNDAPRVPFGVADARGFAVKILEVVFIFHIFFFVNSYFNLSTSA